MSDSIVESEPVFMFRVSAGADYVEARACHWAQLSDGQRDYLRARRVSPTRYCQLTERQTERRHAAWVAQIDLPDPEVGAGPKPSGALL